jgi:Uma2 family endonuclease
MGMPAQDTYWTLEMVRALPEDGNRYEVLDGALLVSPAPSFRHQRAVRLLVEILAPYTRANEIGETLTSPADIELSPTRLVQPDVFVIPAEIKTTSWQDITTLLLSAEVISPSTARWDRFDKRTAYQEKAIPEYWVVDLDSRAFERWRPGDQRPELLSNLLRWRPVPEVPALDIDLVKYFADVWR